MSPVIKWKIERSKRTQKKEKDCVAHEFVLWQKAKGITRVQQDCESKAANIACKTLHLYKLACSSVDALLEPF